jgi:hypothetical protein
MEKSCIKWADLKILKILDEWMDRWMAGWM